ncbi:MAG: isoprenylcysteine carboxylmethyltransferase family protein [Erythrobacter sp.]|uniref:methyltransferase family protein n=1 Tax=Erythrobacter sp. TaxID=1042 RepID=UPI00260719ED|nr:isoprenylcysteine carboxylmethyltransferase family protein [Erythrobacter sp.]MDJ0977089.1 isoprenylcysteine carboxylmethyltransferase family protein [Erythrobacter sp.]
MDHRNSTALPGLPGVLQITPDDAPACAPESDVSTGVGLAGLLGLAVWVLFCRTYPLTAEVLGLPGPREPLSGPHAALMAMVFTAGPMAIWSVAVDRVHLRLSTGLDWSLKRPLEDVLPISAVKIVGLWSTWGALAALFGLGRWYWEGNYLFAMHTLGYALAAMVALSVPYAIWLDRYMVEPRDAAWHFGARLLGRDGWEAEPIKKHWRAWLIKGFFGAFMISILPVGFAIVVEAQPAQIIANPVELGMLLVTLLFMIDVQIGTVGYLFTLRPLDAHIRSGNPFLAGWVAALLCYPPFAWGVFGAGGVLNYEVNGAKWDYWLMGSDTMLWLWAAWIVALTALYAWATFIFGIRFSNLTYRGVITNGPYRFTRHPAYLSKNLYWWCFSMPFLAIGGSPADVARNCFFLLCVNAIYYWRARTEEAHLLAEDAKYRAYHAWMEEHGLITAPLARLKRRVLGRRVSALGFTASNPHTQPAE